MLERLSGFSTSELCDGSSFPRAMDYHIKPWVGDKRIVGRAVTVDVPAGEGDLIADAILQLKKGDVLVIAGKGCCDYSYWGDFRSFCARTAGAAGVVIDGGPPGWSSTGLFGMWRNAGKSGFSGCGGMQGNRPSRICQGSDLPYGGKEGNRRHQCSGQLRRRVRPSGRDHCRG